MIGKKSKIKKVSIRGPTSARIGMRIRPLKFIRRARTNPILMLRLFLPPISIVNLERGFLKILEGSACSEGEDSASYG